MSAIPTLAEMTAHGQEVALAYFEAGRVEGWQAGHDHALRELGYLVDDAHAGRNVKRLALQPSHADLLERRGQHQAADQYRAMLTERGLTA